MSAQELQISAELASGINTSRDQQVQILHIPEICGTSPLNMLLAAGGEIEVLGVGWIHKGTLLRQTFSFTFTERKYCFRQRSALISHSDNWNRVTLKLRPPTATAWSYL